MHKYRLNLDIELEAANGAEAGALLEQIEAGVREHGHIRRAWLDEPIVPAAERLQAPKLPVSESDWPRFLAEVNTYLDAIKESPDRIRLGTEMHGLLRRAFETVPRDQRDGLRVVTDRTIHEVFGLDKNEEPV